MAAVIQFFDRSGTKLGETYQDATREWVINEPGEVEFSVSVVEEQRRLGGVDLRVLVEFGNLVYIPNQSIGDFVGVITRRAWKKGILTVWAKSAEFLFSFSTPQTARTYNTVPGTMFTNLLEIFNKQVDTVIYPGEISLHGKVQEFQVETTDLLSTITNVADSYNCEFDITPEILSNGKLKLNANWYEKRAIDVGFHLIEGHNYSLPSGNTLQEDGENIINHAMGWSDTATENNSAPLIEVDEASEAQYGARYGGSAYVNLIAGDSVKSLTQESLKRAKKPVRTVGGNVLDVSDSFLKTRVGNAVIVDLYSAGFKEGGQLGETFNGRITACRYTDKDHSFQLVMEENL